MPEMEESASSTSMSSGSGSGGPPALQMRVQSFEAERLDDPASRERLFHFYSANGECLLPAECDRMLADVASGWRPDATDAQLMDAERKRGWRRCVGHVLAAFGCYKPELPLLSHLMYYHTLFWVICRAPDEQHIPVVHRVYFVVLSIGFNLLVLILFMASDASLVTVHCPPGTSCSQLELTAWRAAEVGAVAVVDTTFWPLLKLLFLWLEERLSKEDESEAEHNRALWQRLALLVLAPFALGVAWLLLSAGGQHSEELERVAHEFLSTWPTTRLTEAFKLMSVWGLLTDLGLPRPPVPSAENASLQSRKRSIMIGKAYFREASLDSKSDSKSVPLLAKPPHPGAV